MGIAAYNRGTRAIRRGFDQAPISHDRQLIDDLNATPKDPGASVLFGPTYIRLAGDGSWCLMNHPEKGWSSYAYPYPTVQAVLRKWNVVITAFGQDACSFFYQVEPLR